MDHSFVSSVIMHWNKLPNFINLSSLVSVFKSSLCAIVMFLAHVCIIELVDSIDLFWGVWQLVLIVDNC